MTTERTVIIPNTDNNGASLATEQAAFETRLLAIAGGFTADNVRGAWRGDDGTVYRDASVRYVTCVTPEQDAAIVAMLPDVCRDCRQEALYTSSRALEVDFISAPSAAA